MSDSTRTGTPFEKKIRFSERSSSMPVTFIIRALASRTANGSVARSVRSGSGSGVSSIWKAGPGTGGPFYRTFARAVPAVRSVTLGDSDRRFLVSGSDVVRPGRLEDEMTARVEAVGALKVLVAPIG